MKNEKVRALLPFVSFLLVVYIASQLIPRSVFTNLVESAGSFGPIIFILLSLVSAIFAPLSGTPLTLIGFHLFGHNVVFLLSIAAWISYAINFLIAKNWGRPVVAKFIGRESINKLDEFITDYGYVSLFFIRMFGGSFHDFVSYAFGLTAIKFIPYLVISWLGSIPGTLVWYAISLQTESAFFFTLFSVLMGAIFSSLFILWKKLTYKTIT